METIRVSSDPYGRAIKRALEHLQSRRSTGTFADQDMPSSDADLNGRILEALSSAGLVEALDSGQYQLTPKGRECTAQVTIPVPSAPPGPAVKEALEQLQVSHSRGTFGYADLPSPDADLNSRILSILESGGLIETAGLGHFQLTEEAKDAVVELT